MVKHTKKRAKRILYLLRKKVNCKLYELSLEEGKDGQRLAMTVLGRLIKKGLVNVAEHPHGNNLYYLTEEGKRIADEIVKEVNEYKRW